MIKALLPEKLQQQLENCQHQRKYFVPLFQYIDDLGTVRRLYFDGFNLFAGHGPDAAHLVKILDIDFLAYHT